MSTLKPRLTGKRVALLAVGGAHEHEFWVPYYRFLEENATLIVAGPEKDMVYRGEGRNGRNGLDLARTDAAIASLRAEKLDALVIPGGVYGPLALRVHEPTLKLVRAMDARKKIIGAICHGPWVLASAGVLKGRRATGVEDIAVDVKNAGAQWVDRPAVRDGHLVTAVYYGALPQFVRLLIEALTGPPNTSR